MSSRTVAAIFFGGIVLYGVLDTYDLLPTSRSRSYAFVTSFENYQLSAGSHHHCRIHAVVPTKIVKKKPAPDERDLLRGATGVEVTRSGYCGHIAKTWQPVRVDLREPDEVEFDLDPERDTGSIVLVIGLGVVLLGLWLARGPARSGYRRLERWLGRRAVGEPEIPAARIHEDREREK
jgi:hypothetical protein